jgi:hypothetical protein
MSFIKYRGASAMSSIDEPWKNELYKAHVARWKAEAAAESERRKQEGKIAIWLERGPDDAEEFTKEFQAELDKVLSPVVRDKGLAVEAPALAVDAVDAVGGYTGQLIIDLAKVVSPVLTAALVAWVKGKPGRKVRVEFHPDGKLKAVEAQTEKQVLTIIKTVDQEARAKTPKSDTE